MPAELNVGSVVGYLRLDRSAWSAEIQEAKGQADELRRTDPKVKITTNAASAIAELEAVAAAAKRLQDAQGKVNVKQDNLDKAVSAGGGAPTVDQSRKIRAAQEDLAKATRDVELSQIKLASAYETVDADQQKVTKSAKDLNDKGFHPLIASIALLGPAAVPLGALVVSALGPAILTVGALGLAFLGAKKAMDQGNATGEQYSAGIDTLKTGLDQLERVAAAATLPAFNNAVAQGSKLLPNLNEEIGRFGVIGGDIADHVLHGLIGGFVTLEPLFTQLGLGAEHLAEDFDRYSNGGGLAKFQTWMLANLPTIERVVVEIFQSIGKLTAALGPMGIASLNAFGLLARGINALPLSVLKVLVPVLVDGYVAIQAYKGINGAVNAMSSFSTAVQAFYTRALLAKPAAEGLALAEDAVAVSARGAALAETTAGIGLGALLGPVGAVIAGVGLLAATFLGSKDDTKSATQAVQDYTQALIESNGAVTASIRTGIAGDLSKNGALGQAQELGLQASDIVSAIAGNQDKLSSVRATLKGIIDDVNAHAGNDKINTPARLVQYDDAQKLLATLNTETSAFAANVVSAKLQAGATNDAANAAADASSKFGEVEGALLLQTTTAQKYATIIGYLPDTYQDATYNAGQYTKVLTFMKGQEDTANTATQGLLAALDTYSQSAGTAADKSALLGAVLKASQGDALTYGGAITGVYDAQRALISGFDASQKAAINSKTGLIDYTKVGAGPLVQELQNLQDAALTAAQATYQHELATKGDKQAVDDATAVFQTMTNGALTANYKQLGITKDEAQKLSDQYFNISDKDLKSKVEAIGLSDINTTLQQIAVLLGELTGHPWGIELDVNAKGIPLSTADAAATAAQAAASVAGGAAANNKAKSIAARAAGGPIGEGWTFVGEQGIELVKRSGSNVMVYSNPQTRAIVSSGSTGVAGPTFSSPAATAVRASYNTPSAPSASSAPASAAPTHAVVTTYVVLDGQIVAQSVNEHNLQGRRR